MLHGSLVSHELLLPEVHTQRQCIHPTEVTATNQIKLVSAHLTHRLRNHTGPGCLFK